MSKKTLGQKELGPKKLWSKKMLSKKLRFKKFLGPNKFQVQQILGPTNFGYTNFWKKDLALKKSQQKFWDLPLKFGQN